MNAGCVSRSLVSRHCIVPACQQLFHCASSTPGTYGRYRPMRSIKPSYFACNLSASVIPCRHDDKRFQHLIADQLRHLSPLPTRSQRPQLLPDRSPAVQIQHRPIGRRRRVERHLRSLRSDFLISQRHKGHRRQLDRATRPIGLLQPRVNRGQNRLADVLARVIRMDVKAIGHFAGEFAQRLAHARDEDRDIGRLDRSRAKRTASSASSCTTRRES